MALSLTSKSKRSRWKLRIYIRASIPQHLQLLEVLRSACRSEGLQKNAIEIVDVEQQLGEVEREAIIALPMLVRISPGPIRRIVGSIAEEKHLKECLGLATKIDRENTGK